MDALLTLRGVSVRFGGIEALSDLDLDLRAGEVHGLIGPNGSGKSTLINTITGLYRPWKGTIVYEGEDLVRMPPHRIARRGIGRSFQDLKIFGEMTVLENVLAGMHVHLRAGALTGAFALPEGRREERQARENALTTLREIGLEGLESRRAAELSFGQQRLLELARLLALRPRVVLLDEPAAGLNPRMIERFVEVLFRMKRERRLTVLLVEHVINLVMDVCDRVTVLEQGRPIASGLPGAVQSDPAVIAAYLGSGRRARRA